MNSRNKYLEKHSGCILTDSLYETMSIRLCEIRQLKYTCVLTFQVKHLDAIWIKSNQIENSRE